MKKTSIRAWSCILLIMASASAVFAQNFWQQTSGPYGGNIIAFAINPSTQVIFAGTGGGGVFRSTNNGDSWIAVNIEVNTGSTNTYVVALAINASGHIFAGTHGHGVFRSTNNGDSWTAVNTGLTYTHIFALAINSSGHIFAGANNPGGGVFRSTNNGDSWTAVNTGLTNTGVAALAINASGHVFAGTNGGVFRSTNNGDSWTAVNAGLTNTQVLALAINASGDIFAGKTNSGVFRSTNNGDSWTAINTGLTNTEIRSLVINNASGHIFAGTYNGGVFRSTNNGDSWTAVYTGLTNTSYALAINASGHIFVGSDGVRGGVFRSTNNGSSWSEVNTGLANTWVLALSINASGHIFAGKYGGVSRSTNNGDSWTPLNTGFFANTSVYALAINASGHIFAGANGVVNGHIFRSTNNGDLWTPLNTGGLANYSVNDLAINLSGHIFAGTTGGVFRSTNNGDSWTAVNTGLTNTYVFALAINASGHVFAGTNGGVFRSTNNGDSWTAVNTGLTSTVVSVLAINASGHIFASGTGVFRSTNNGDSWTAVTSTGVYALAINASGHIFASGTGGASRSTSNGDSWIAVNTGLTHTWVSELAINLSGHIFAGTKGGGVFRSAQSTTSLLGTITGLITDANTNQPIQSAQVSATGGYTDPDGSDASGYFQIPNVPAGFGYQVTAYKGGYNNATVSNIKVEKGQITSNVNIALTPLSNLTFSVQTLSPDPNPASSTVMQGGKAHRYYKIVDASDTPRSGIAIELNTGQQFSSNADGILTIEIPSSEVGNGDVGDSETFTILKVNDQPLPANQQIAFSSTVSSREYATYWNSEKYREVGLELIFRRDTGSSIGLLETNTNALGEDELSVGRLLRASVGAGFTGTAIGASIDIADGTVTGGAYAGAGVDAYVSRLREDEYEFGYHSRTATEAMAQYALVSSPLIGSISPLLVNVLSYIETIFTGQSTLDQAYLSGSWGTEIKGLAHAEAEFSTSLLPVAVLETRPEASVSAEARITTKHTEYKRDHLDGRSIALLGSLQGSASTQAAFNFGNLPWGVSTYNGHLNYSRELSQKLNIWRFDGSISGELTGRISIEPMIDTNLKLKQINVKISTRGGVNVPIVEKTYFYKITSPDPTALTSLINNLATQILYNSLLGQNGSIIISSTLFSRMLFDLFNRLGELAAAGKLFDVEYEFSETLAEPIPKTWFDLNVALGFELEVSLGNNFELRDQIVTERGKWLFRHYPLESYDRTGIPEVSARTSLNTVMETISNDMKNTIKNAFTSLYKTVVNGAKTIIEAGRSKLELGINALVNGIEARLNHWSWWGPSAQTPASSLSPQQFAKRNRIRLMAQAAENLRYGIGGFYQLTPQDAELAAPSQLTIAYTDAEVAGIDENSLAMYKWDEAQTRWVYVGGTVEADSNRVTAAIDSLKTYTLAPAMPYGRFGLVPNPSAIPADSSSTTIVTSELIRNNDGSVVPDGALVTVKANGGTIIAPDANPSLAGLQVAVSGGTISFALRSDLVGMTVQLSAETVEGESIGTGSVQFTDNVTPAKPKNLLVIAKNEAIELRWSRNTEKDLAGYKIYFDTDESGPPYEGQASIFGANSPLDNGNTTSRIITGLVNDSTYYLAVTAYDLSGNESDYSVEIMATPRNYASVLYQFTGASWNLVSLPVSPSTFSVKAIFPTALSGIAYSWQNGTYITTSAMEAAKGFWLANAEPWSGTVDGMSLNSFARHFAQPGWYLIGSTFSPVDFINPNDNPDGSIIATFGWDPTTQSYYPVTTLEPGQGYWIAVAQECDLTIGGSSVSSVAKTTQALSWQQFAAKFGSLPPLPPSSVISDQVTINRPADYSLSQNYPNPFNPETVIEYQLPEAGKVSLKIYDLVGREVRTLVNEEKPAGYHRVKWDGRNDRGEKLNSGVYLYRIQARVSSTSSGQDFVQTRKVVLLK